MAKLEVVGVGPGSPDYLTAAAVKAVEKADLIIGAQRSLELFSCIKGEIVVLTAKNLKDALKKASETVKAGKNVALLSTGDPGFSGLLHTALESGFFAKDDVHVVPAVGSIQASAAALGISWDTARLFTFHDGDVSEDDKARVVSAFQCGRTIMLLPAPKGFTPKDIAALLLETGADPEAEVDICENVTLENQKITNTTLKAVSQQAFGALCVMVIKPKA